MVWFNVLIALVVVGGAGRWLMHRKRRGPVEPMVHRHHFNPSDVRGRIETHDFMRDSWRSAIRKQPGSRNW